MKSACNYCMHSTWTNILKCSNTQKFTDTEKPYRIHDNETILCVSALLNLWRKKESSLNSVRAMYKLCRVICLNRWIFTLSCIYTQVFSAHSIIPHQQWIFNSLSIFHFILLLFLFWYMPCLSFPFDAQRK